MSRASPRPQAEILRAPGARALAAGCIGCLSLGLPLTARGQSSAGDHATGAATAPAATAPSPATSAPRPRKVIVEPAPPRPDVAARDQAEEANLESNAPRRGITLGVALIGWQQVSTIDNASRGGGLSIRLGAVATPNTIILLELAAGAFPNLDQDNPSYIESSSALVVAAQTYVRPTLWLRAGGGLATYTRVKTEDSIDMPEYRVAKSGVGVVTGIGIDVVRWRTARLSLETIQSVHRFSRDWLFDLGFGVGLTYY